MKYINLTIALVFYGLILTQTLNAQNSSRKNVQGIILDQSGQAIGGALISDNQNEITTFSNALGEFNIQIAASSKLTIEKLGYVSKTLFASDDISTIVLNAINNEEQVQVAFKKTNKNMLMGGVSFVEVDELMDKSYFVNSLDNMEALANGFHGNLWGNNSYLYLVDGLPRDINSVVATEIDQITFLKGASAVALYGSRAAKGVVLITTKRGTQGKQVINFRANSGVNIPKAYPKYLGSGEYMTLYNEARLNDNLGVLYSDEDIYNHTSGINPYRYPNLDFYSSDYLQKLYSTSDATLEIYGGNDNLTYYTNLGYWREGNILNFGQAADNASERINVRGNIDIKIDEDISAYVDASLAFRNSSGVNGSFWNGAQNIRPNRFTPLIPIDMIDTTNQSSSDYIQTSENIIDGKYLLGGTQLDPTNPFADIYAGGSNKSVNRKFQFSTGIDINLSKLLKGLSFKSDFGIDYTTGYTTSFNNTYATYQPSWNSYNGNDIISSLTKYGEDASTRTQNISNNNFRQTIAFSSQLNYSTKLDEKHHFSSMLIANGFQQSSSGVYHKVNNINAGIHFGYNYDERYYLDFNESITYSTKLPEGRRVGFSPTGTLSWRISNESFLKSSQIIDDFRLSLSGGLLTSDLDINDYYIYESVYGSGDVYYTWKDGLSNTNTAVSRGANPFLNYPQREEWSLGLYTSLWDKTLTLDANIFKSRMTGLVTQISDNFPNYFQTGWPSSSFIPYENYNAEERKGYDFNINVNQDIGVVELNLGVVGTYYETKAVTRIENYEDQYQSRLDRPLDGIWGLISDGFYSTVEEIDNGPTSAFGELSPGDIKYIDQNNDGVINAQDEVLLGRGGWYGSPFTLGINLTAKWKDFTLFVLGTGRYGAKSVKSNSYFWVYGDRKYSEIVRNRWTPETAETATYPRLTTLDSNHNFRTSDFWLYSTDRFDLSRVQISYELPIQKLQDVFLNKLQLYVGGTNLLTISKNRNILETNIGWQPQTRFFNLGLNASF